MHVRHFGFLANCCRRGRLGQIHEAIAAREAEQASEPVEHSEAPFDSWPCPRYR